MKQIFFLILFLLSHFAIAETEKLSIADKYNQVTNERMEKFTELQKEIVFEDKKCLGADFSCALTEISNLGVKSTNDLYGAVNILTALYQKKLKSSGACQEVCRANLNAEFIKSALELTSQINLQNYLVYQTFKEDGLETTLVRAGEDLSTFQLIQRISHKLLQLNSQVEPGKIFKPELAKEASSFEEKIIALEKAPMLKKASLLSLKPGSPEYKAFLESGAEGKKDETIRREAVDKFRSQVSRPL